MSVHQSDPLVGPIRRRGWRDIVRLAPLTARPHIALVVSRRGRITSVIPANTQRTLSDYLDWPFEYREVDMRERLLTLDLRLDSRDTGYAFNVALQLVYQAVRPERVAVEHIDVLHEFETAIVQRARAIAWKLGIEEEGLLREYLVEALTTGNELPRRFEQLGLALRRVDITIKLDRRARDFAESIREQFRDRPLLMSIAIESNQPGEMFEVHIGGFYRLRTRDGERHTPGAAEKIIRNVVQRTLRHVAARFAPHQEREAEAAMTDELWNDTVLKATLAASNLELLRPAVQVQAGRRVLSSSAPRLALTDKQVAEPSASDTQQASFQPGDASHPEMSPFTGAPQMEAAPQRWSAVETGEDKDYMVWNWNNISSHVSVASNTAVSPIWEDEQHDADSAADERASLWSDSAESVTLEPGDRTAADDHSSAPSVSPSQEVGDNGNTPPDWVAWRTTFETVQQQEAKGALERSMSHQPSNDGARHEIVARWLELLRAQEAWLFRYVARIIVAHPEKTAEVIGDLTTDPALYDHATDPACCALLAETLKSALETESAEETSPAKAEQGAVPTEEEPDWMVFRRAINNS